MILWFYDKGSQYNLEYHVLLCLRGVAQTLQLTDANSVLQGGWSWAYLIVSLPDVFLKITIRRLSQGFEENLWP